MSNRELFYLGLGMLLPATAVAIVATLAHKFPKRVSEKWATIVAVALFALATIVLALTASRQLLASEGASRSATLRWSGRTLS